MASEIASDAATDLAFSKKRRWASLLVLLFGQFVVSIDMTVLSVAVPQITADLHSTSEQQLWIMNAYTLVVAGLLIPMSSLSDRTGRKRMIMAGFAVFGASSLLAVFAQNPQTVIAIRALLGVGGAMIMPVTLSMVRIIFSDPRERALALSAWSVLGGIGLAAGPIIGGALIETHTWHSAFLINVPLMLIALAGGAIALPEIRMQTPRRWDILAAAISFVGMVSFVWGAKHLAAVMAPDPSGIAAILIGICLIICLVIRCLRSDHPLIDFTLFASKPYTASILAALGCLFVESSLIFLFSQWLQIIDGCTPLESGIKMVPMALAMLAGGFAAPQLGLRFGVRNIMASGLLLAALSMIVRLFLGDEFTYPQVIVTFTLAGLGTGSLALGSAVIMCSTPAEKASSAASSEEIAYDLGSVLGVAVLGSVSSVVFRTGFDTTPLAEAGFSSEGIERATESIAAAAETALSSGVTAIMDSAAHSFANSLIAASALGGAIVLAVAFAVFKLIPKDLSIDQENHG